MDLQIKKKREITKSPKKEMGGIHISSTKLKNVEEGSPQFSRQRWYEKLVRQLNKG